MPAVLCSLLVLAAVVHADPVLDQEHAGRANATQIAYVSNRRGPKEIYVMDYDGYGQQRITNDGGFALYPAFAPNGDQIAYVSYRSHDGVPNVDIAMLNRGGSRLPSWSRKIGSPSSFSARTSCKVTS